MLLVAVFSAGCAHTPRERVAESLQPGGELYLLLDAAPLQKRLSSLYFAAERGVAKSDLPGRESTQMMLTMAKLLVKLSGANEIAAAGASSREIAPGEFANRITIAARPESSGWIWRAGGREANRLQRLGEMPGNVVLAVDFGVDFTPVAAELRSAGAGPLLDAPQSRLWEVSLKELLTALSGEWQLAVTAEPDSDFSDFKGCGFYLSLPDRDGILFRRISTGAVMLFPGSRQNENVIYLPENDGIAPVIAGEASGLAVFSSPEVFELFCGGVSNVEKNGRFIPPDGSRLNCSGPRLRDNPRFARAVRRLPGSASGAFYASDETLNHRMQLGNRYDLTLDLSAFSSAETGVWQCAPGIIKISSIGSQELASHYFQTLCLTPFLVVLDRLLTAPPEPERADMSDSPAAPETEAAEKCRTRMLELKKRLDAYSEKHGRLPARLDDLTAAGSSPESIRCGDGEYVYFGSFDAKNSSRMPLLSDPPAVGTHRGITNVLFADGTVESFKIDADSLKRLCSYLHTLYHYDEKEFVQLIERASKLDAERAKP